MRALAWPFHIFDNFRTPSDHWPSEMKTLTLWKLAPPSPTVAAPKSAGAKQPPQTPPQAPSPAFLPAPTQHPSQNPAQNPLHQPLQHPLNSPKLTTPPHPHTPREPTQSPVASDTISGSSLIVVCRFMRDTCPLWGSTCPSTCSHSTVSAAMIKKGDLWKRHRRRRPENRLKFIPCPRLNNGSLDPRFQSRYGSRSYDRRCFPMDSANGRCYYERHAAMPCAT